MGKHTLYVVRNRFMPNELKITGKDVEVPDGLFLRDTDPEYMEVGIIVNGIVERPSVTVYKNPDGKYGGAFAPCEVNWSACGSKSAAYAVAYAEAIAFAAELAEAIDEMKGKFA